MDNGIQSLFHSGGIGFVDAVGGSVDGLMSCTESLGFESSDGRRIDDQIENLDVIEELRSRKETIGGSRWKRKRVKKERQNFPPPLSSLYENGKPTFSLRLLRKDGKIELQEEKIDRPEIFRARRKNGRLRLDLIKNEDEDIEEENMQEIQEDVQEMVEKRIEEEEVEERVEGW